MLVCAFVCVNVSLCVCLYVVCGACARMCARKQVTITLQHTAPCPIVDVTQHLSATIRHTAARCNALQYAATHCKNCNAQQHTATHSNAQQHTATYCSTMQHTAPCPLVDVTEHLRAHFCMPCLFGWHLHTGLF